jgi:hypothetical protein
MPELSLYERKVVAGFKVDFFPSEEEKRLQLPSEIKSTVMASLAGNQWKRTEGITAGKF